MGCAGKDSSKAAISLLIQRKLPMRRESRDKIDRTKLNELTERGLWMGAIAALTTDVLPFLEKAAAAFRQNGIETRYGP
jgi:hypothetical protein